MIYTLTFNPSIDYVMTCDNFNLGSVNRASSEDYYAGGKGINVSYILKELGYESKVWGFIAGFSGDEIERTLKKDGLNSAFIKLKEGFSRINVKLRGNRETEINGSGPVIGSDEIKELFDRMIQLEDGDVLVLSGSIPSSLPNNVYQTILSVVSQKDVRVVVDAEKDLLMNCLKYRPFLIKPNQSELEALFNVRLYTTSEIIEYAKKLQDLGARNVIVSRGRHGAILLTEEKEILICPAASGEVINSVGSGDSLVAGFLAGYLKTENYESALKLGVGAGSATAFSKGLAKADKIEECYNQLF